MPMSRYKVQPIDLSKIATYPLASRPSKVTSGDFAQPVKASSSIKEFLRGLPNILAARDLHQLAELIREARRRGRAIIVGLGGHVIKTGLAPVLIDLMQNGFVAALAMNGFRVGCLAPPARSTLTAMTEPFGTLPRM